uniref:tetratricopeptide repeat protein n=1 Tax=Ekhidna sp. TaxID=2608089 RepID=UPI0032EB61BF
MRKYFFLLVTITHYSLAQNAVRSEDFVELSSFENFQARKYQNVISEIEPKTSRSSDEEIILLLSELKTGKKKPEAVERWLETNPKHPINPLASYHLGEYYFYDGDSVKSRQYLSSISPNDLTRRDRASYGLIYGIHELGNEKYQDAKNLFEFARNSDFSEESKLNYYTAYTDYHLGDNDGALAGFNRVKNSEEYGNSSRFFIAKIQLEKGEIDAVIALAQNELSEERSITNSGFYQLVGEAYALKNDKAKADAFFEKAIEVHPGKPSAALYYQAGVSKFKIGNEEKAIAFLTQSGIQGGEYAQLSAFQLGRLYVKKKEFEKALTAYIEASTSENETIKEESLYEVAHINARLGFYSEAINYSNDYLTAFKEGKRTGAIQDLIVQSYLRTSNYDLAIEHLNRNGISNETQKNVYQKVTFQKAQLLFNDGEFTEADKWFRVSLKYTPDQQLKNLANYHLGEIALRSNSYDQAITFYKSQSTLDPVSNYGLGYAYYNKQQYGEAVPYFRKARNSDKANLKNDASVRLADCLYATKSYQEAFSIYDQLSTQLTSPYLTFQKGVTLKNIGKGQEAISNFRSIFSDTRYGANALFQAGMIEFEAADFKDAEPYFSRVIQSFPTSSEVVESLLNRGICKKNLGQLEGAKADYETILTDHLNNEIALNAILGLQELQQAGVSVNNLDKYIASYKQANPESGSLELIEFEAAKRRYFDFSYVEAAKAFDKYLDDYPRSGNRTEASYYLGDSYYRMNDYAKAKPVFDELKYIRNALTGRILSRLGEINRQLGNKEESEEAYRLLISLNLTPKDTYNARQGLMTMYFASGSHDEVIAMANQILQADWKPINGEQEALLLKARSWMALDNPEQAAQNFKALSTGKDVFAAEANYYLGLISYQQEEYEKSLDLLFDLNTNFGSYTIWVDRSYLLIAKNYIAKEELFQAKATLRSIIQHSNNEDVKSESQKLLNEIEQQAASVDSTQTGN